VIVDFSREQPSGKSFSDGCSKDSTFDGAYLIWDGHLRKWSWDGYGPPLKFPTDGLSKILTPACTVDCLRSGYRPVHCPFVAGLDEAVRSWPDPPNGRADTPPSAGQEYFIKWPKNTLGSITETVNEQIEKERQKVFKGGSSRGYNKKHTGGNRSPPHISLLEPVAQEMTSCADASGKYPAYMRIKQG